MTYYYNSMCALFRSVHKKMAFMLFFLLFTFLSAKAQVGVTVTNPTNTTPALQASYSSLAAALTDLNLVTSISGPVTLTAAAGSETAPSGGYVINFTATTTATNNVVITGTATTTITAFAGQTAGNVNNAIFKIIGSDYVTIQNFTMQENAANTTTTLASNNMTEFGVALFYASTTNGAQNNTIQNNIISLNRTYLNTFGIYSNTRHSATAMTTTAEVTSAAGSNSFNKVYGNTISNVNFGIVFIGAGTTLAAIDSGNDIGGSSLATGNTITNWGGGAAATSYVSLTGNNYCIFDNQQINDNISYNTITSASLATSVTEGGILKNYSVAQPTTGTITTTINNNTVTVTNNPTAATTGAVIGINNQGLSTLLSTATMSMNNNVVQNCVLGGSTSTTNGFTAVTNLSAPGTMNMNGNSVINNAITATTATSGVVAGVTSSGAAGTLNMNSNIVRNFGSTAASGQVQGIINSGAVTTTLNINSNQLGNATGGFFTTSTNTSGGLFGISTSAGASACNVTIQNNDIRGITYNTAATAAQTYITQTAAVASANINGNTFTNLNINSSGAVLFINHGYSIPSTGQLIINNNSIVTGFNRVVAGSITLTTSNSTSGTGSICNYTNNNFSNITVPDNGASTIVGFNNTDGGTGSTKTITGNTFDNWNGGATGTRGTANSINCMNFTYWNGVSSLSNNTITNITGRSTVTGITLGSASNAATSIAVSGNIINNLISVGTGGAVTGITCSNTSTVINISSNTINTLSTTAGSAVNGIVVSGATTTNVFKNKIYDLSGSNASSTVNGILVSGGTTVNTYNNRIGDLRTPAANAANPLIGISVTGSTTSNVYYNTVNLNGSSTGALFGSSAISASTTPTLNLRNNVFINTSTTTGAGLAVAYRRSSTTLTTYASTSNNNMFYATSNIFTDGTNTDATFTAYKTRVSTRDNASFSAPTTFLSTVGSNANFLKVDPAVATQLESGGAAISGITDDFDGDTRNALTPDVGSDEFAGSSPAPAVSALTIAPTGNQCTAVSRHISVSATTPSGTITGVVINYSLNGVSQTAINMTNTSGSTWEGDIPVASPVNAAVVWSVTATNSLSISSSLSGTGYQDAPLFGFTGSASATPATVCTGSSTTLKASLTKSGVTATLGAGGTTASSYDGIFYHLYGGAQTQFMVKASELATIGIGAGNLTALGINMATSGTAYAGLTISIAQTTNTDMSAGLYGGTFTQVYTTASSYTTTSGINTFTFGTGSGSSSTFNWDGSQNLVIKFCWSNNNGGGTSTYAKIDALAFTSCAYYRADNTSVAGICGGTSATSTTSNRPQFIFTGVGSITPSSITWNDGASNIGTGNNLSVSPSANTTYTAALVYSGCTVSPSPSTSVTIQTLPSAPTATNGFRCGSGVVASATVTSTTGLPTPTFKWYAAATGGTALQSSTSTSYTTSISATTTLYVTEYNGTCESSPRTPITLTINPPPTVSISVTTGNQVNCGIGNTYHTVLQATSSDPGATFVWSTTSAGAVINSGASTSALDLSITASSDITLTTTPSDPTCNAIVTVYPISVYPLPNANVTTTATGVCPGTNATIDSGLSAGNFTAQCITPTSTLSTPPASAVTLINAGTIAVTQSSSASVDDGYWNAIPIGFSFNYFGTSYTTCNIGTNGTVNFGATGSTQFNFSGPPKGFPSTANPANTIAVCARDLYLLSGSIKYWTEGTAPNRRFIIQYANCPGYVTTGTATGNNSIEAVFYETLGTVDIRVISALNGTGGTTNAITKYIGLQNGTQTIGATAPNCSTNAANFWNGVTNEITTPQAWRFSPPANYNVTWSTVGPGNTLTTVDSGLNHFTLTVSPSVTTTYNLSYTNTTTGCTNLPLSDQVTMTILSNTAPATTAVASVPTICLNGSSVLSLTGNVNSIGNTDGLTYQWQVSTDNGATWSNISGATSATTTVTPTVASTYQCLVAVCNGTAVASSPATVSFTNNVATTTPATRCGTGTVTLGATTSSPGATLNWYAAATGGTALGTGSSFTTPSISTTTTYYVAAETTGPACSSPRVAVIATVTTPPAINLTGGNSTSICLGNSATLTTDANVNYDTFAFSPTTGAAYSGSGVFTFNPTATTVYTVTASQSSGQLCSTTFTYTVTVNSISANATASASVICVGSSVTLNATNTVAANGTAITGGTGTGSIGGNEGNPYRSGNGVGNQIRTQILVKASELTAAGIVAGNITSLAFSTVTGTTGTLANFSIAMANTSATALTTTFETTPVTQVFSQASFTPADSGWNTHTFQTPFNWDGTSNLLINVCQTNSISGTATVTTETLAYNATSHKSGTTTGCTDTTASSSLTTRPIMRFGALIGTTGTTGATYAWTATPSGFTSSSASTTASPTVTTTYHVVATSTTTGCSSAPSDVTVTTTNTSAQVTTPPANQTKCVGTTATFTVAATGVNLTYQWRKGTTNLTNGGSISGATSATLTIANLVAGDAGNYNVVISSDCGTPTTSTDAVLTLVNPLASINASATTVCSGTSVNLDENGGSATSWSWAPGGQTTRSITVTPTVTTTYVVTATTQLTGCTATASVTVNVNETPSAITVAPVSSTVCSGSTVQVNATGGNYTATYFSESFDAVSSSFTAETVTGTTTTTATLDTTYHTQGTGSVLFNTTGDSSEATYSLNSNVNLSGATTASLTFSHIASMEGPTTSYDYGYVEYSSDGGSTWTTFDSANYTGSAASSVFSGTSVRFSTMSYPDWISTFTSSTAITPTNALWKNETFTIPTAAITSQFKIRFRYTKDSSTSYAGWYIDNVKVNANGNSQYAWSTSPTITLYKDAALSQVYTVGTDFAPTVYAQPTAQTQFTVNVANGPCSNSGSATVNINALPVITLANNVTVCKGTGTTITIPENNNNYSWSPSTGITVINSQSVLANPVATTTYTVTTTNTSNFCQSTRQITVNVNDGGTVVTQPADKIVAAGYSTSFTVAGSAGVTYSYQWQIKTGPGSYANLSNDSNYAGVTSSVLTVSNAGTGTALDNTSYRCLLTPPSPCADLVSNDALLTVSNTGIASSPADVNICLPTPSTAQFTVVTNGDDPYLVEWQVSTDNGATYNPITLIDVNGSFLYIGPDTTAVPGLTFEHPASPGDPNGTESNFKVLNVSGITNPATLKFKAIVNEVLPSAVATLNVSNPVTFTTNLSTTEVKRCVSPVSASATNLSVTATGSITSVQWRYDTTPGGSFSNVVTNNTPAGATYVTSSAGNTYSLAVTTNGSTPVGSYYYKAFIVGSAGCGSTPTQSDMATITVVNPTVAITASSASYCSPGSAVTLTATGASTYSWTSVPAGFTSTLNGVSVTPTVATAYSVVGTDSNGCTNSASVNVGVGTSFTVAASAAPTTVCPNAAVTLTAVPTSAGPATYLINTVPYQFNAVSGTFTALSGTTVSSGIPATDDDTMSANITPGSGFTFNYGGTNYTTFRVSSNGQLVFGTSGTQTTGNDLATTTSTYRPGLAPLWDDLLLTSGVNYQMSGTAPNRVLTVEWLNMQWNYQAGGAVISFQVKLYETTNVIEYVYRQEGTAVNTASGGASIGLMGTSSSNFISLQDTSAAPVLSTSTSKNDIGVKPATGQIYRFTPVTPVTYSYAWTSAPSGFTATGASATANPTVSTGYTVTATSNQGCKATGTASVTVNSAPPVVTALPATLNVCQGATATFTVTATSSTPLTYQWKRNGSPLTNGSGITGATTATLTITGTTPANNGNYTVDVSNCTTVTSTVTALTVNPLPTATVSGTTSVCQNATQPVVTFTGASGTAPYTFTYTLNGSTNQTITTTSGNSVTIAVPTTATGVFAYALVSVQDSSSSACSQAQSGTATVTVNAVPAAPVLSTNSPVCAGNTLNLSTPDVLNPSTILTQNFEGGLGAWVVTANSTGGTNPSVANFALKNHGTTNSGSTTITINSPGGTKFVFADADGAGSGVTLDTKLTSPSFSTVGYTAASLSFRHYHKYVTTAPTVEISTNNGSTWTSIASYSSTQGTPTNFTTATISLNAYLGQPNVKIRFNYTGGWIWYWAIDDISITGTPGIQTFTYAWSGPNSFSSSVQNPSIANATTNATGTYTLQITNSNGCKASSTVNAVVGAQPQWYLDADGDHYYTGTAISSCTSPGAGYTTTGLLGGGDCNDGNNTIYPGAPEICYNNILENCTGTMSQGCAPVVVNMTPSYNNTTLPSLSTAIPAVAYTYGSYTNLKYRFRITNITTGAVAADIIQTSRYVTIPASIHSYNAQYSLTASAVINDEVVPFAGNTIVVNSPVVQLITLNSASCGATLAALTSTLTANAGLNATGYTFRIRVNDANPSPTYAYSQSSTRFISANSFTGFPLQYGASYKVAVQYTFNDPVTNLPVDSGYGAECTVNTPSIPVTTMASPTCGSQVTAMNANISATAASYATGYQFRIRLFADNGANPTYNTSVANASRFSSLTAFTGQGPLTLAYNTEYAVSVRYSILNGSTTVWSDWGPDCKVKTPFFPVTSLVPSQCGLTTATSLTQQLNITPYPGFPNYKVKLDEVSGEDIVNSQEIVITYSYFRLNQFSIAQLGKNYNVSVAIKLNGEFGPYDTACDLFTPAPAKTNAFVPFKATAYPNPFANNFMLDVKSSSQSNVSIKVYDMIGRMIEQKEVRVSDMETTTIGDQYPSGVYNVVVSQEDSVETVRVVKR